MGLLILAVNNQLYDIDEDIPEMEYGILIDYVVRIR